MGNFTGGCFQLAVESIIRMRGANVMDKKLIRKMVQKCFVQYRHDDTLPFGETEFEEIYEKIVELKSEDPEADLHEIINDAVYEFLAT
ncbi:MAG: YqzH family protein [Mesobacillus sp.]|uniref:YqzH family protein n=1 Tax=Mesobacillus sp. TaxID=2675271 RepID=UPI003C55790C